MIALIFLFAIVTYIYWGRDVVDRTKFSQYILSLSVLGTCVSLYSLILTYKYNDTSFKKNSISSTIHNLERSYMDLEKLFMDYYPYSVELYREIYNNCDSIEYDKLNIEDENKRTMVNSHLSSIIFQLIENTLIFLGDIKKNNNKLYFQLYNKWYGIWMLWFNSQILKSQWQNKRILYSKKTQQVIDMMVKLNSTTNNICNK